METRKAPATSAFFTVVGVLVAVTVAGAIVTNVSIVNNPARPAPLILHVHAVAAAAWFPLFVVQAWLGRRRAIKAHRTLGWAGAALGVTIIALAIATIAVMPAFHRRYGVTVDASYYVVPIYGLVVFGVPFVCGAFWRGRRDVHARLMYVATCAIAGAGFQRLPWILGQWGFPFWVDGLILLGAVRDYAVTRRIHVVYLVSLPLLVVCQLVAYWLEHQLMLPAP